jgi:hypothetical protein
MQYVSWKDDKTPQVIPAKKWTLVVCNKLSLITPTADGLGHFGVYLNVKDTGGSKRILVRFSRDPKKLDDFTGQHAVDLTVDNIDSHTWFFQAKKGVPIGVMVYHDGPKPLILGTREFKAAIG